MKKRLGTIALVLALMLTALPVSHAGPPPANYVVTSTSDSGGVGTLRGAINQANVDGVKSIITFSISGSGVHTIQPLSPLPTLVEDGTTIDGYSQPGASASTNPPTILIEIDGDLAGAGNGLTITSAGNTIKGLAINSFGKSGIAIGYDTATGNEINGNYIGTDTSGTGDYGNGYDGVYIFMGAHDNTIGGDLHSEWNVIGGNDRDGIRIAGNDTTGNVVTHNFIGTNTSRAVDLGNAGYGVHIYGGAHGNTIGIHTTLERNTICANDLGGIRIAGSNTRDNVIAANYIGVSMLGNDEAGVLITDGAHDNTVGASNVISHNDVVGVSIADGAHDNTIGSSNTISHNDHAGVSIFGANTMSNTVSGNRIHHNGLHGIVIHLAQGNVIGGDTESERNFIYSHSNDSSVFVSDVAQYNILSGNTIGIDSAGSVQSNIYGIEMDGASYNTIGPDNVISGNTGYGVGIANGQNNTILGNYIGTDAEGTLATGFGNGMAGIRLDTGAIGNTVGGDTEAERNVISGNQESGVVISGENAYGNVVLGNYIGTAADGAGDMGNAPHGVHIDGGAHDNTVGPDNIISHNDFNGVRISDGAHDNTVGPSNTVSYNDYSGIAIAESTSNTISGNSVYSQTRFGIFIQWRGDNNIVSGNYVGITRDGVVGANQSGIVVFDAQHNTIGPDNVVSGNTQNGVDLTASNNIVFGNYIGTDVSGAPVPGFGNGDDGIMVCVEGGHSCTGNTIGGPTITEGNVIYGNGKHGVDINLLAATGNHITHNSIYSNTGDGIRVPDSWTPAAPVIAATMPGSVQIVGIACAGCTVEVFANSDDDGEGETFVGEDTADGSGTFVVTVASLPPGAPYLTATATDGTNTTSEFSDVFESTISAVYLPLVVR